MTTPKDIEAAEKFLQVCPFCDGKGCMHCDQKGRVFNGVTFDELAQALAAAREEGRRSMLDDCLLDLDHHMEHQEGPWSGIGRQALHDLRLEIEGIPTNAPEGESLTKAKKEIK